MCARVSLLAAAWVSIAYRAHSAHTAEPVHLAANA